MPQSRQLYNGSHVQHIINKETDLETTHQVRVESVVKAPTLRAQGKGVLGLLRLSPPPNPPPSGLTRTQDPNASPSTIACRCRRASYVASIFFFFFF